MRISHRRGSCSEMPLSLSSPITLYQNIASNNAYRLVGAQLAGGILFANISLVSDWLLVLLSKEIGQGFP